MDDAKCLLKYTFPQRIHPPLNTHPRLQTLLTSPTTLAFSTGNSNNILMLHTSRAVVLRLFTHTLRYNHLSQNFFSRRGWSKCWMCIYMSLTTTYPSPNHPLSYIFPVYPSTRQLLAIIAFRWQWLYMAPLSSVIHLDVQYSNITAYLNALFVARIDISFMVFYVT